MLSKGTNDLDKNQTSSKTSNVNQRLDHHGGNSIGRTQFIKGSMSRKKTAGLNHGKLCLETKIMLSD